MDWNYILLAEWLVQGTRNIEKHVNSLIKKINLKTGIYYFKMRYQCYGCDKEVIYSNLRFERMCKNPGEISGRGL